MRTAMLLTLLPGLVGCGASPTGLTVFDYDGAAGYGRRIRFEGDFVAVISTSDYQGQHDKVIWGRELSPAEAAFLRDRIHRCPVATLQDTYRDPGVWDGLQITFDIRKGGRERCISVANEFVEELAQLCDALNAVVPWEHRVRYREWKGHRDRERQEERERLEEQKRS